MGADILERLNLDAAGTAEAASENTDAVYMHGDMERVSLLLTEAAAEIGRLRGEVSEMAEVLGEAYQVVGCLLSDTNQFDAPHGEKVLDNLSQMKIVHDDVLPWASVETPAPAMPNGVEAVKDALGWLLSALHCGNFSWDADQREAAEAAYNAATQALRAADNRDAAGVHIDCCDTPAYCSAVRRCTRLDTPAAVPAGEAVASDDARLHAATLRGISSHLRACPPYEKLRGDADCIDAAADFIMRTPQPADGEAVAWIKPDWQNPDNYDGKSPVTTYPQAGWIPLYTTPPAPVQAAPQEGDRVPPVMPLLTGDARIPYTDATAHMAYKNGWNACVEKLTAHPSACELGADGVGLIAAERKRQVAVEGWTAEHDDEHFTGDMAAAAACYAYFASLTDIRRNSPGSQARVMESWPWDVGFWKPGDRLRELTKAGALIAAEIDRLQRAAIQHRGDSRGGEG